DGGVEGVEHLADVGLRRPAPRVRAVDERASVCRAVLRRHEERIRRDVVDERELPLRMTRVVAAAACTSCAERLLRGDERWYGERGAAERQPAQERRTIACRSLDKDLILAVHELDLL